MWSQRLGGLGLGLLPTRSAYQLLFKTHGLREDLEPWTASSFLPDSEQFHTRILSLRDLVLFCFLPPLLHILQIRNKTTYGLGLQGAWSGLRHEWTWALDLPLEDTRRRLGGENYYHRKILN